MPLVPRMPRCLSVLAVGFALCAALSAHALTYSVDDGTVEVATIGRTFANHFTVVPGGQTIASISIAWALVTNGTPATVKLWSDPDGNGNPGDALVLSLLVSTVANTNTSVGPATFATYDIPDFTLALGQSFFVGATLPLPAAGLGGDISSANNSQSWVTNSEEFVGSTSTLLAPFNLMIRASTVTAVTEPTSLALLGLGLAAFGMTRAVARKHKYLR